MIHRCSSQRNWRCDCKTSDPYPLSLPFGIHLRGADAAQPPIGPDRAAACLGHGVVGRRGEARAFRFGSK
jgi:hypothetical protein